MRTWARHIAAALCVLIAAMTGYAWVTGDFVQFWPVTRIRDDDHVAWVADHDSVAIVWHKPLRLTEDQQGALIAARGSRWHYHYGFGFDYAWGEGCYIERIIGPTSTDPDHGMGFYRGASAGAPTWLMLLVTTTIPSVIWGRAVRHHKRRRTGLCVGCGYDLRASPDRCPECGAIPALRPNARRESW